MTGPPILVEVPRELRDVVNIYLETRGADLDRLEQALSSGNLNKVRFIGHKLHGSSESLGFAEASRIGGEMERAAVAGDMRAVQGHIARLRDYFARVEVRDAGGDSAHALGADSGAGPAGRSAHSAGAVAPKDGFEPAPAHPDDPLDLDFTSLVDTTPHPEPPEPTSAHLDGAVIGAHALGEEGFHVIVARPRSHHPANKVVLVVDDDLPTAELAAHVLRKAGYQVAVAGTPHDAARQISRLGAPALVILDIELPEMSGIEFLRRMRAHKRLKDTPVILFTAHSGRQDIVRGLQAGADGYLAKPVSATALVSAVRTVLDE